MRLKCLWDNVLVKVEGTDEKVSTGGIVMPATRKKGTRIQGEILAVGPGKPFAVGGVWLNRPMGVTVGQRITFEIGAGTIYPQDDGSECILLLEEQITGVFPSAEEIRAEEEARDRAFAEKAQT